MTDAGRGGWRGGAPGGGRHGVSDHDARAADHPLGSSQSHARRPHTPRQERVNRPHIVPLPAPHRTTRSIRLSPFMNTSQFASIGKESSSMRRARTTRTLVTLVLAFGVGWTAVGDGEAQAKRKVAMILPG